LETEKKESSYAEIIDVEIVNRIQIKDLQKKATQFLQQNSLQISDIDAIVLGFNGDSVFDPYYKELAENDFAQTPQVYYKHLSGEYNTASAFGLYIAANIIKSQQIPEILKVNSELRQRYQKILLYNQYRGLDHSFILISQC
jgi:predicted naringenin-chalcone synthase